MIGLAAGSVIAGTALGLTVGNVRLCPTRICGFGQRFDAMFSVLIPLTLGTTIGITAGTIAGSATAYELSP